MAVGRPVVLCISLGGSYTSDDAYNRVVGKMQPWDLRYVMR